MGRGPQGTNPGWRYRLVGREGRKEIGKSRLVLCLSSTNKGYQIQPGGIEVSSIPNKVANGEVWVLEGARNYA